MKANPKCPKCKGKGLLPFKKNGKVVPHAFLWCDCYEEENTTHAPSPEDFDFPMSATFRSFSFGYCGLQDPGIIPTLDTAHLEDRVGNLEAISAQRGGIPRQYHDQFQQIRGEIAYLHKKIAEQPAKKQQPTKSTYKGLEVG